ncbi:RNB-domain-containing protein, partial [Backusella circina FSU 941]
IPIDVTVAELKEANRLIEEFMLRANISVAHKVLQHFPDEALLRRHEEPNEKRLEDFRLLTEKLGLDFDTSTAGTLQQSFQNIPSDDLKAVLQVIATRPMKRAKYFCTGSLDITKYRHYALNESIYTHFTSPIRRYADVIIHRELYAALEGKEMSVYAKKRLQEIANDCNRKRDSARNAQDLNNLLYLGVYLNNLEIKQGPVYTHALVVSVRKRGFDIYLPEYGLEKSIGLDRLPLENAIFDKD